MIQSQMLYYTRKLLSKIDRAAKETLTDTVDLLSKNSQLEALTSILKNSRKSGFRDTIENTTEDENKELYDICLFNLDNKMIWDFFVNKSDTIREFENKRKIKISERCKKSLKIKLDFKNKRILKEPDNQIPENVLLDCGIVKEILGIGDSGLRDIGFIGSLIPIIISETAKKFVKEEVLDYMQTIINPSEFTEDFKFTPVHWGGVRYTSKQFKRLINMGLIE